MASETQLGRSLSVIFIGSKCSVKLQIVYGLKMSKIATFGHSHHSSFFFTCTCIACMVGGYNICIRVKFNFACMVLIIKERKSICT